MRRARSRIGAARRARARALAGVAFAAALVVALASTARAQDDVDPRPEVVLWHAQRAAEQEALERFVADLNARERDYRVTVLAVPYDAFLDKITAAIPRGRGPDVFIAPHDRIGDWAEAGTVAAVDDVLPGDVADSLHDGLLAATRYKGAHYGVPLAFKSLALWRNLDLAPTAPATLSELERAAVAATKDGTYGLVYENRILFFHAPLLHGFGGRLFADDGRPVLDDPKNVASVRYAMKLGRELNVVPQEVNGTLTTSLFNAGKAAFIVTGPWSRGEIDPAVRFAVSPLPVVDVGDDAAAARRMTPFLTVEAAMISGKTEKRPLAVRLAKELAGLESSERRLVQALQPVAHRGAWRALDAAKPDDRAFLTAFLAQLPATVPTPNSPAMKAMWSPADAAIGESMGQGKDPAVTLAEQQKKLDGVMAVVERPAATDDGARAAAPTFLAFVGVLLAALSLWVVVALRRYGVGRLLRDVASSRTAYLYAAPAMIGMAVLVLAPFVFGVGMGFFEHRWGTYTFVGLKNFASILSGDASAGQPFLYTLGITVLWTASNVFLHVVIGVFLALVLSQARLKFRGLYRVLFIIPWAVPNYITALVWKGMFHPEFGAVNQVLGLEGFSWMNHTWSAFLANLATNTWLGFPFMMVTALGGLTSIPKDLYEAAALDGAGPWKRFTSITLPLLRPVLAPAIVLGTVWTFNMFNIIYLVSGGAPGGKTDILITEAFRWAFERGPGGAFGYAAAYATMIFLLLLAYSTAANRVAAAVKERA